MANHITIRIWVLQIFHGNRVYHYAVGTENLFFIFPPLWALGSGDLSETAISTTTSKLFPFEIFSQTARLLNILK